MTDKQTASPEALHYDEVREFSVLEHALMRRGYDLVTWVALTVATVAIALALFHLYVAVFGTPQSRAFRSTHLTGMMVLAVLLFPLARKSWRDMPATPLQWGAFGVDALLVFAVLAVQVYTLWDLDAFSQREGELIESDLWMGFLLIFLVMETTRRSVGLPMVLVTSFFVVHSLYADMFGGFLYGPPTSVTKYIDVLFIRSEGMFGIPISVAATYIVLFIIFGAILIRTGAGRMLIDLAISLTGHRRGGPAKASVVASAFLGTVSGSAVANVVTTGSFTIPLMRKLGYRPKFAAAVEACASSGGQITPPIMGAAAFIIAEFMHVSYFTVIVAAIVPTLLYFATIYFMVDIEADKDGIKRLDKRTLPRALTVLKHGWHQLLTLAVLVGLLAWGYSPMMSAFWAIVTLIVLSFRDPLTRMSPVDLLAALESGVRAAMPVTVACGCAGIIIGSIFVSGLGLKFTNEVINIADGNLLVLLALTGVAAIILGMGMTTTAVYITVAALIVPSLIHLKVEPMAAHMFAFYYGVVSTITPPVALASFAAAAIAGSSPMATSVESARIGIAKYLVPFAFVYNPSLLFIGPVWLTCMSAVSAFISLWGLSVMLEGWFKGPLNPAMRLVVGALSVMALLPPMEPLIDGLPSFILPAVGALGIVLFAVTRHRLTPETVQ
jgi:TRAP transporter 4TM/12TM fusion protein